MRTLLLLLAACSTPQTAPPPTAAAETPPPPPPIPDYAKELVLAMDSKANACEDFYQYACGNWMATTELPADKAIWGKSFSAIRDRNLDLQRKTMEAAAANPAGGDADYARLGAMYGSCMDETGADANAMAALTPWLKEIDGIKDIKSAMRVSGHLGVIGVPAIVSASIWPDFKDPSINLLHLSQGGLALPDRDYYLGTDDAAKGLLAAYEKHIGEMLTLTGSKDGAADAKKVLEFETAIAKISVPRDQLRDPEKVYHKIDRKGLTKLNPKLGWDGWLEASGVPKTADGINLEVPEVYTQLEALLLKTDVKTLKAYLRWQLVHSTGAHMGKAAYDSHFAFFGKTLSGQKEPEPRWKRCVSTTDGLLGEISGKSFVEQTFAGDSKQKSLTMIQDIEAAFAAGLPGLSWMDDATRERAVGKMKKINNKIGYPDVWRDYSALTLTPGTYTANVLAARSFEGMRSAVKVGKPVERGEWLMSPAMVNAYYDPSMNEMAFPAGILQSPFFNAAYPVPMNYGAIGMVMGHELTHGFDDTGRKFDGDGKMVEWWAPEVGARFEERAACVTKQYSEYKVGDLNVNGQLTLGENIADIGGYRAAYRAYKKAGAPAANVPGLTDDQLFFVAAAQSWCVKATPEIEKMRVLSDTHSPPRYRVNGPLSNLPEFAEAFGCAQGTPMRPANACEVW